MLIASYGSNREMSDKLSRKDKELENVQQKLIDAVEEEKTIAEERLRYSQADRRQMMNGQMEGPSDEEDTHRGRWCNPLRFTNH